MSLINRLDTRSPEFRTQLTALLAFEAGEDAAIERTVADILSDVRTRGDAAVLEYTRRFDRHQPADIAALEIPRSEWLAALNAFRPDMATACRTAWAARSTGCRDSDRC